MRRRIPMTVEAPSHGERGGLRHTCHLVDAAVARLAAHAFRDVNRVIEECEIRQRIDAAPGNRPVRREARAHGRERRARQQCRMVAFDARARRRQSCERRGACGRMTVLAIDPEIVRMNAVIERNRLNDVGVLSRRVRRSNPEHEHEWNADGDDPQRRDGSSGSRIGPSRKKRHCDTRR